MSSTETNRIRVGINGGGFAGAVIARGLLKYPYLDVRIYESAPTFRERGAAVGLATNALDSLEMIDPKLRATLDAAGGVASNATKSIIGDGSRAGETLVDIAKLTGQRANPNEIIVHRARFLQELMKDVPASAMRVNKKLVRIEHTGSSIDSIQEALMLHFSDGSHDEVDAVIGADGIHGYVRGFILGEDNPATKPVYAGWWDTRNLVKINDGIEKIGAQYVDPSFPQQHAWVGHGGFLMHDIIDSGEVLQCVAAVRDEQDWDPKQCKRPLTKDELLEKFGGWLIGKPMAELLDCQEELTAFSQWEHHDTPTFFKGNACIMGDAAHAMTPWQGSGAGQAIEDAFILQSVFKKVTKPSDIHKAFKAYDSVRRLRAMKIVRSSKETGLIFTGQVDSIGMDPDRLRAALATRWDFIHNVDLAAMERNALDEFGV